MKQVNLFPSQARDASGLDKNGSCREIGKHQIFIAFEGRSHRVLDGLEINLREDSSKERVKIFGQIERWSCHLSDGGRLQDHKLFKWGK